MCTELKVSLTGAIVVLRIYQSKSLSEESIAKFFENIMSGKEEVS